MESLIDIGSEAVARVLRDLLVDKTTKKNIIWATDTYEGLGDEFSDDKQMDAYLLRWHADIIRPRIEKSLEAQAQRTRKKAEVFTPAWLCNKMNNALDEDWFGRENVFNTENEDHTWTATDVKIEFPEGKSWQSYVDSRRLEITCGEAPYLVSRYDVSTGEIIPVGSRIGILDRKLRVVNENAENDDDWLKWIMRAFESVYGYEYQGDNVLIARINLLLTFVDYYKERMGCEPSVRLLEKMANKISWNIWQMDGLKCTVPLGKANEDYKQLTLFDVFGLDYEMEAEPEAAACIIKNWRGQRTLKFMDLKERAMGKKLFDYVIGNPPYNENFENSGDNGNFAKPVYNEFMDAVYGVADKVELIHPARFLFNAGSTPKAWNEKMLNDTHFKILSYESDSSKVFSNTDIKGGIAISYFDATRDFGSIGTFTAFPELNSIVRKCRAKDDDSSLASIIYTQVRFDLDKLYEDHPEYIEVIGSKGKDRRFRNNAFEKIDLFSEIKNEEDDIKVLGVLKNKRTWRYIPAKYVDDSHENLKQWKTLCPRANGAGVFGELLSPSVIGEPNIGYTQTFIGIGAFDDEFEAEAVMKYIKFKFARTLLDVLKVTQDNDRGVWKLIPLQNFTPTSDIDWSKSIPEIDRQLYAKYGLDEKEIEFIETHVKEMV